MPDKAMLNKLNECVQQFGELLLVLCTIRALSSFFFKQVEFRINNMYILI